MATLPSADRGESMATLPSADRGEMVMNRPGQAHAIRCGRNFTQEDGAGGGGATYDDVAGCDACGGDAVVGVASENPSPPLSPNEFASNVTVCAPTADDIRNNGLYGIKGDYNCDIMARSSIMDAGFVQPLGAREEWMKYLAYDMPNKRDQFMVRKERGPLLMI
jgi:hypothetical protein